MKTKLLGRLARCIQSESKIDITPTPKLKGPPPGSSVLDRLHQTMLLFASGRGELMKRFLQEDGIGHDARFWKLAQSLSANDPLNYLFSCSGVDSA
jgi:hypothetical protein